MEYLFRAEQMAPVGPALPSVLLLDIGLPNVTGFEILDYLQGRPAFAGMLKIVISQIADLDSIKRAYTFGAHSFLGKPVNQLDLGNLITGFPTHWLLRRGSAGVASEWVSP
jgi:response regulator RpfG family c-di-GMP phosphodiesterase